MTGIGYGRGPRVQIEVSYPLAREAATIDVVVNRPELVWTDFVERWKAALWDDRQARLCDYDRLWAREPTLRAAMGALGLSETIGWDALRVITKALDSNIEANATTRGNCVLISSRLHLSAGEKAALETLQPAQRPLRQVITAILRDAGSGRIVASARQTVSLGKRARIRLEVPSPPEALTVELWNRRGQVWRGGVVNDG